jgi:hypothetical protein
VGVLRRFADQIDADGSMRLTDDLTVTEPLR